MLTTPMVTRIIAGVAATKVGYDSLPNASDASDAYNFFASKHHLSKERRVKLEERRAQLKIEEGDSPVVKILIDELLAYKPIPFTLDDRYLQLEQILDAIDKAKTTKQTSDLVTICERIITDINPSPGIFKNSFLERLQSANQRINHVSEKFHLRSKL